MQTKDINIELEPIDIRKSHVHSCPAVAVPVEGESIGSFMTDNSKVSFEEEPNTAHHFNKKAKKESDIQNRQLRSLRKVKSAQPVNDPSGRQINKNRSDSSENDGPSPLRMPQLDEGKDDTLPGLLSDFKGPPLPRRVWSWLFCLTLVLYYTAVLAMMMNLLVFRLKENPFPLDSTSGAILYIAENYRFDPIMNVNLTSGECPNGFTEAKLTTWPGTRDGCYTLEDGDLEPKLCDNVGSLNQESVYSISQQDLYIWKGYKWCIQRASQELDYVFTESCPAGFRNCATGYCFKESLSCPITGLTLRDANSSITNGSKLLTIRRDEDELPMISINVSMNGLPCFSLDEDPQSESPYILLKTHKNGCVSFGEDQSSFEIDRDVQEDFLQDNNVPSSILNLPGYNSILESTAAILVGRRKLNVAATNFCANLDIDVFEKAGNSIQSLNTAYTSIVISVVILHIMIGLVLTGFFCGRGLLKRSLGLILWRGKLCYRIFFLVFFALEVTALTTLAVYVIIYKAKLDSVGSYFNQVISSGCFSQTQAENVITSFSKFKSENIDLIFIYSLISAGITLIFLVILSRAVCYARKPSLPV